jgi:hypothetical protein
MNKPTDYLSVNEIARELGIPSTRLHSAIASGSLKPDARAGLGPNAPILFSTARLAEIREIIAAPATKTRMIVPE